MGWTIEDWQEASNSPDWGIRVADELRAFFRDHSAQLLAQARLVDVSVEADADGVPVLLAVYDHPGWTKRTGLRRRLNSVPFGEHGQNTPEASQAAEIALYEISEPLGRYYDLLVEDSSGVWWWGDGYPGLAEDPNAPWYAGLPIGRWLRVPETWTIASQGERVCPSAAIADVEVADAGRTVLFPPQPVHCIRPDGHAGVHVSALKSKEPNRSDTEVFGWD